MNGNQNNNKEQPKNEPQSEKQRNDANNANNVKNAADVAIASKEPHAMAVGGAVKAADKITGGKASEGLGKAMTNATKMAPGGRQIQRASNRLSESGASDSIGKAASMKSGMSSGASAASNMGASGLSGNGQETTESRTTGGTVESSSTSLLSAGGSIVSKIILSKILIIAIPVVLVVLVVAVFVSLLSSFVSLKGENIATRGYFDARSRCSEVTVYFADKSQGYKIVDTGTYDLEEYVAGVLIGEVGEFGNAEVYKEMAIAARTYFFNNEKNCTIESSDRKQVFKDITGNNSPNVELARQSANETAGRVILKDNESLYEIYYDAFCSIAVDNNYYTIKQQGQKIPRAWVDSQRGIASSWKQGTCAGNHGMGISQWGSYYLATEENYDYIALLEYYLNGTKAIVSSDSFAPEYTTDGPPLLEPISNKATRTIEDYRCNLRKGEIEYVHWCYGAKTDDTNDMEEDCKNRCRDGLTICHMCDTGMLDCNYGLTYNIACANSKNPQNTTTPTQITSPVTSPVQLVDLRIRNTTDATQLHERLDTFLSSHQSSMNNIETYVKSYVDKNGQGTREGVVAAAVSLVNYLYENYHVSIPYYWGGNYQKIGVNPAFGGITEPSTSNSGRVYNYAGLDCSGFVSWAIRNGGYNLSRQTSATFDSMFSGDSCNISNSSCKGRPGDLINSASCHVQMIVAVDEDSGSYYVAESTADYGVIMRKWGMHKDNCGGSKTKILHMDNYYNNSANKSSY